MEAARSRILTRELLELPQIVARLAERVKQVEGQAAQFTEWMDRGFNQIANDRNRLKERAAMDAAREQSHVIAAMLGPRRQLYLHANEIIDLARLQSPVQPCSLTQRIAFNTRQLGMLTLPRGTGKCGAMRWHCSSVISMRRIIISCYIG